MHTQKILPHALEQLLSYISAYTVMYLIVIITTIIYYLLVLIVQDLKVGKIINNLKIITNN